MKREAYLVVRIVYCVLCLVSWVLGLVSGMRLRFCLVFVAFYLTGCLLLTVYLRGGNDRVFYRLCQRRLEQKRLAQQLAGKQLRVENLINPASVSEQAE